MLIFNPAPTNPLLLGASDANELTLVLSSSQDLIRNFLKSL